MPTLLGFGDNPEDQLQINAGINAFKVGNIDQGFKFLDKTLPLETEISKWLDLAYKPSIFDKVYLDEIFNLEKEITKSLYQGLYDSGIYKGFTQSLSDWLVGSSSTLLPGLKDYNFGLNFNTPIGAFYDSQSPASDTSPSITNRTPVLLDANNNYYGLNYALLDGRDTNNDGKLTGGELAGLVFWSDTNENGVSETWEVKTLAERGVSAIASADYGFYTRGNAARPAEPLQPTLADVAPPTAPVQPAVPGSNFRYLRDNDNTLVKVVGSTIYTYNFKATDVKISKDGQYIVGTDGAENFGLDFLQNSPFDPQKERQHFSRKLKWGPSDFSGEKLAGD